GAAAAQGERIEVGADAVTAADGVAAGAELGEHGRAGLPALHHVARIVGHGTGRRGGGNAAARRAAGGKVVPLLAPFRIHGRDGADELLVVARGVSPLPLAGGAVAEHDVVAVIDELGTAVAELVADGLDVLRQTGQEQPAGAGVKGLGVLLEALRRIPLRLDAN